MTSTNLWGPFSLTPRGIDAAVTNVSTGVYALGKMKTGHDEFEIRYVGRDDQDIRRRLRRHIAEWYPLFYYRYYDSEKAAFEKECELYHDFNPRDNPAHPARREDTAWRCPRCTKFD